MRRVAVIDIGTVTARLAVADVEGARVVRLAKSSNICNLGEGVAETGRLARTAMERVISCVGAYVESAREAGAEAAACTLTSAARDASNSEVFLAELRERFLAFTTFGDAPPPARPLVHEHLTD